MNRALREFICDQKRETLANVMNSLKLKMNFDATAIDHLHLALLSFKVRRQIFIKICQILPKSFWY